MIDCEPRRLDPGQLMCLRDPADCLQPELSLHVLLHVLLRDIERFKHRPALAALLQDG